jgi:branched-chain amino acid transport system permease protein
MLIAGGGLVSPTFMDGVIVFGFVAAVLGGLDSFIGRGGRRDRARADHDLRHRLPRVLARGTLSALVILLLVLLLKPGGLFSSSVARRV